MPVACDRGVAIQISLQARASAVTRVIAQIHGLEKAGGVHANRAEAPRLPPSYWANAAIRKYFRPLKTQISFRIDNEVLDWLKSKGQGHLSRINEILRRQMASEQ